MPYYNTLNYQLQRSKTEYLHVQHTPYPPAHGPPLKPPLLTLLSLKNNIIIFIYI